MFEIDKKYKFQRKTKINKETRNLKLARLLFFEEMGDGGIGCFELGQCGVSVEYPKLLFFNGQGGGIVGRWFSKFS